MSSLAYFEPVYYGIRIPPAMLFPGAWMLLAILAWLRGPTPLVWLCFLVMVAMNITRSVSIETFAVPLIFMLMGWATTYQTAHDVRMLRAVRTSQKKAEPERGGEPDHPADFNHQLQWIAVKSSSTAEVAQTIGLKDAKPTNWRRGLEWSQHFKSALEGHADIPCFVSAEVDGWVFVLLARPIVSPREAASFLAPLSSQFGEAQYFIRLPGKRGVYGWDLAKAGDVVRSLRQTERGFFFTDGEPTDVEARLLEPDRLYEPHSGPGADGPVSAYRFAIALTESAERWSEMPFTVAAAWSLDPSHWPTPETEPEWLGLAGFVAMEAEAETDEA